MITSEGALTAEEVDTLKQHRNSELFRIVRKLCAHEYSKLAEALIADSIDDRGLQTCRGMMRGVRVIYGLMLHNAELSYIDGKLVDSTEASLKEKQKHSNYKPTKKR